MVAPRSAIIVENTGKRVRLERVDVAHTAVDHEPREPAGLGAGGEHLAPVAARGLVPDVDDEHRTGRRLRDRDVDREVVGRCCT